MTRGWPREGLCRRTRVNRSCPSTRCARSGHSTRPRCGVPSSAPGPSTKCPRCVRSAAGTCRMEPGGFEPPCRNGQRAASTRVVDALISIMMNRHRQRFTWSWHPVVSFLGGCQSFGTSPIVVDQHPIGRQMLIMPPEYQAASAYCVLAVIVFASFLRGKDAPRRATTSLPHPVDTSRPQCVKELRSPASRGPRFASASIARRLRKTSVRRAMRRN